MVRIKFVKTLKDKQKGDGPYKMFNDCMNKGV